MTLGWLMDDAGLHEIYGRQIDLLAMKQAITEAWMWLEGEGLLAPQPGSGPGRFITRRGRKIATDEDWGRYRRSRVLPRDQLHPRILPHVWPNFLVGKY